MIYRLIDFALVVLQLLMFKFCGIIRILNIYFFKFFGTERVKLSDNSWYNSYILFLLMMIKFSFTCSKLKLHNKFLKIFWSWECNSFVFCWFDFCVLFCWDCIRISKMVIFSSKEVNVPLKYCLAQVLMTFSTRFEFESKAQNSAFWKMSNVGVSYNSVTKGCGLVQIANNAINITKYPENWNSKVFVASYKEKLFSKISLRKGIRQIYKCN